MKIGEKALVALAVICWVIGITVALCNPSYGRERIYDNQGTYRGRVERDYSGSRDRILDQSGRRIGTVDWGERRPRSFGPSPDIRGNQFWKEPRR